MTRIVFILFCFVCALQTVRAGEYNGNKLLELLGENKNSDACDKVKVQYLLDKTFKNPESGIKLTMAHDSVSVVTAIMITSAGCEINDVKYKQFSGIVPFDISFDDDEKAVTDKLGEAKGSSDDGKMKFKKDGITINIYFKTPARKKISYIKFTQNIGMIGPYRLDGNHDAPKVAEVKPEPVTDPKTAGKSAAKIVAVTPNKNVASLPDAASFGKSTSASDNSFRSKFYRAIMSVIESGEEEMFKDIKKAPTTHSNFWNYKYTYATAVAIPGEKYNMLYSFPFQKSQLDFVSVLEETDGANPVIQTKYNEVEAELKKDFPQTEGWSYHYIANPEDPKGPKDFELKSAKLGSIVLDHSVNPVGKHVLYLRFLLQYN